MGKQTFINEMTCNFNLREPKAKKPTNIYFIVCIEGKQIKFSTGVKVYPEQWNKKKQEAYVSNQLSELDNRNNTIVNKKITAMKKDYMDYKNYLCDYPDQLTLKKPLLKQFIYKEKMTKIATTSAIATMKRIIVEKRVSDNSKQQYTRNINKFERFLKEHHIKDEFQHINLKTIKCYQQYLIETGDTPKTIKNIIKGTIFPILKQVDKDENIPFDWNASKLDSFELAKDYSNKELAKNKRVALTEEQILSINKYNITKDNLKDLFKRQVTDEQLYRFQEIKDMFVFQCYVGQRISDLPKFFNGNNTIDKEHNTISIIQQKTGATAYIPILPIAQDLLDKYKGKTLRHYREGNTFANSDLKKLLKIIGEFNEGITYEINEKIATRPLYELIHTHTARHTFVTIMCRKDIPKETVILATGHEDTKMIDEVYSHLTHKDKSQKVAAAFEKAFNPEKVEASTENINANRIYEMIQKGIAEALKPMNKDIQEIKEVTDHIKANKETIKEENVDMIIGMVVSLMKDNVSFSAINNMLDTTGLLRLQSASDVMTGNYYLIK